MSDKWDTSDSHLGYRWFTYGSRVRLQVGHRWVTNGSYMSSTLVTLSNTTFLVVFSELANLYSRYNFATIQTQKIKVIFIQSEEVTQLCLLLSFCDASKGGFWLSAHWGTQCSRKTTLLLRLSPMTCLFSARKFFSPFAGFLSLFGTHKHTLQLVSHIIFEVSATHRSLLIKLLK